MTENKKSSKKKDRTNKYEKKLHIIGTLDEVLKVSIPDKSKEKDNKKTK